MADAKKGKEDEEKSKDAKSSKVLRISKKDLKKMKGGLGKHSSSLDLTVVLY